jgi:predicted house-cleaning noncanonical NTP pyrophosphatase (MazG superfamily)
MRKHYNKLVRDRQIELIKKDGNTSSHFFLPESEMVFALRDKIVEEANEIAGACKDKTDLLFNTDLVEELADLHEVLAAFMERAGIAAEKVEAARVRKAAEKGTFKVGIKLMHVDYATD